MFGWLKGNRDERPSYEEAKAIAQEGDAEARRDLAALSDLEPELLYYFATDKNADVRETVAKNSNTPLQAKAMLAKDSDENVRKQLAGSITDMTENLKPLDKDTKHKMVSNILEDLASDQLPEVRAILSEEIKTMDNIPAETVSKLARDLEAIVCAPVLEYSPILDDDELVEIVQESVNSEALSAIAKRANLGEGVATAVAETENSEAVQALLENKSANINDNTLTFIAEKAVDHENWQGPLVERPKLPEKAVANMAEYVSTALVNQLIEMHELPDEAIKNLRRKVFDRLNKPKSRHLDVYQKSRAVVGEEDAEQRRHIENVLTELGFIDIRSTSSGEKTLRICSAERVAVALVICSDSLEDSDGLEILEEVKDLDDETRFIMTSHEANEDMIEACKELDVDEFMLKPFQDRDLIIRVEKIFD